MEWAKPRFSKKVVSRAGATLVSPEPSSGELNHAMEVVGNWRSCHAFPLNTFQMSLRRKAESLGKGAIIAQRIKRLPSILAKLRRFEDMELARMQDIGGCRAILPNVARVKRLVRLYERSEQKHKLVRKKDYIAEPQETGYRGVHLVFKYHSDRNQTFNGLCIEMQIRTKLQHIWSTAVETMGVFVDQPLKSNQGSKDWLRFFALIGSVFAIHEKSPLVPGTPTSLEELIDEIRRVARRLDVDRRLKAYSGAVETAEKEIRKARYFLMKLDPHSKTLSLTGFKASQSELAEEEYMAAERQSSEQEKDGAEVVLVSVDSLAALKRAYPNYYLDMRDFIKAYQRLSAP